MVAPTEQDNSLTARNGGPTWPEDHFLSPFVHMRREMAHPGMTKGFLQLSPEAAMLPGPKDIAGSDITSWKLYDAYMRLSHIIG